MISLSKFAHWTVKVPKRGIQRYKSADPLIALSNRENYERKEEFNILQWKRNPFIISFNMLWKVSRPVIHVSLSFNSFCVSPCTCLLTFPLSLHWSHLLIDSLKLDCIWITSTMNEYWLTTFFLLKRYTHLSLRQRTIIYDRAIRHCPRLRTGNSHCHIDTCYRLNTGKRHDDRRLKIYWSQRDIACILLLPRS